MQPVYQFQFKVTPEVVDQNQHVNNVAYVQWMQDAALRHADASGCGRLTRAIGATWVARTLQIEYLKPAFEGDTVVAQTWVADFRKVRSLRKYRFLRAEDGAVLAKGQTDWVFVEAATGRPRAIPDEMQTYFEITGAEFEPSGLSLG
jgi:acyl-CoA thioester hydrolase